MQDSWIREAVQARARALATQSSFTVTAEGHRLVADLQTQEPEAWAQWADELASQAVIMRLRTTLNGERAAAVKAHRRSVLGDYADDAAAAALAGEDAPDPLDARYALPGSNERMRLGDMKRPDLLAVADHRQRLARANGVEAIFLKLLADRLPDDDTTVAEVVTDEDVIALHDKAESTEQQEGNDNDQ